MTWTIREIKNKLGLVVGIKWWRSGEVMRRHIWGQIGKKYPGKK